MSTNDFIDDFIEEYKNQPCLWKANSTNYKNRTKRQEAYMKLIEVASKHGEHYNIERTKQKINNLRCAFRHQLKKYTECKINKSGKEEPYCPKRKYFESLMFLMEEEKPANRIKLAEKLKEIKMTKVIMRKESPPSTKKELLIDNSNGDEQQEEEIIELDPDDRTKHHQIETVDLQEESENCTVHSEDISVAGESVKDSGGVVYHTDVHQSDEEEEGFKIIWPVGQAKPIEGISTNYIRMAPPHSSPPPPAQSQNSVPTSTISSPMTTTIIHHDLTNSGHTSSATQIALPTSITIQPVPKQVDTVIASDSMQHSAIRRRTVSVCSNKSQSMGAATENYDVNEGPEPKKMKIDCTSSNFEKLLTLALSKRGSPEPEPEDNFSMFGKMVAHKMRTMDSQQAMFAEKIIFDILFEGQMKLLKHPYPVPTQYGISTAIPVSRSALYPIRHTGGSSGHGSIVATSSHQPPSQTFVISSVDCHGTPTEIHATNSAHQTHYSPQSAHYSTNAMNEAEVEEQL